MESYIESHKKAIAELDSESTFLLTTMLNEKRLTKQLLKQKDKNNKEEENVCKAIDEMIEKGVQRGIVQGKEEGKIEGKIESVIELLSDLGEVNETIKEKISNEKDVLVLSRWHKLAARASAMKEFVEKM